MPLLSLILMGQGNMGARFKMPDYLMPNESSHSVALSTS